MKYLKKYNDKILDLKKRFTLASKGKLHLLKLINESEIYEQVYDSNAIENSTLTLDETEKILLEIEFDKPINEREIFEAKNLSRVVSYINKDLDKKILDVDQILFFHKVLMSNIDDEIAGRFRQKDEWVKVANHIGNDPKNINNNIEDCILRYYASPKDSVIKNISTFHLGFEGIHPFMDGNGRIGRVLINYLLINDGYPPINIKFIDRNDYYYAFKEYNESTKTETMDLLVYKALTNSFYKRLAYLEQKNIVTLKEYAEFKNQSLTNIMNKAKRQTIEAFYEKGKWKIGI